MGPVCLVANMTGPYGGFLAFRHGPPLITLEMTPLFFLPNLLPGNPRLNLTATCEIESLPSFCDLLLGADFLLCPSHRNFNNLVFSIS